MCIILTTLSMKFYVINSALAVKKIKLYCEQWLQTQKKMRCAYITITQCVHFNI